MVNYNHRSLDLAFGALAHPIRRGILARLATGEATVAELARPFKVSAPAISKHMRILENAGLLSRRKLGREHRCKLEAARMRDAERWIERQRAFWNERLDALERYLKEDASAQGSQALKTRDFDVIRRARAESKQRRPP